MQRRNVMRKCWTPHAAVTPIRDQCDQLNPERRLQGFAEGDPMASIKVSVGAPPASPGNASATASPARAFAAFAHEVAAKYPNITIALHTTTLRPSSIWTNGCAPRSTMKPNEMGDPVRNRPFSHTCGTVPRCRWVKTSTSQKNCSTNPAAHTVLEIEIGAVGGEEDGHSAEINDKLYSAPAQRHRRHRPSRNDSAASADATWPPSPSATCTAHTNRAW